MKSPLYLLDSYAIIYRSYFAFMNRPLRSPAGANVSAAFGFFRFLSALFDERAPGAFAAVFDPKGKTFRHEMYLEYKANRQKAPEDLHAQVPLVEEILAALKLPLLRSEGWEADDLIAALARRAAKEGRECWVVSGDKDLLQLVGGSVKALRPDSSFAYRAYGPEEVLAEWGLEPPRILDYLSLTGDASDNVPGVPGVGDKTALKLLGEFAGLDDIYARIGEVKPESLRRKLEAGKESAYLSRRLITLDEAAPVGIADLDELLVGAPDWEAANPVFLREGMKSLVRRAPGRAAAGMELFEGAAERGGGAGIGPAPGGARAGGAAEGPGAGAAAASAPAPAAPTELLGPGAYEAVTRIEELRAWVDRCVAAGRFAFDCETDSLDQLSAELLGFSLSCEPGKACYVPLRCPDAACIPAAELRAELERLFSAPGVVLVGHNVKYDYHVLRRFGAPMACPLGDTMIAAWLLDAEAGSFSLEALAERRLGLRGIEFDEVVPKGASFAMVPLERATAYAAEDADFTFRLDRLMAPELEAAGLAGLYRELEMPLVPILAGMEAEGIRVDAAALRSFGVELDRELDAIRAEIWKLCGKEFNIASPKQLQEVLFVDRKLPSGKKTKTGFSTDSSVLEELAPLDPVPERILRHRSLAKLKGTYVESLAALAEKESRVHTHYLQTGAATGRLSSNDPNLQNIPVRDEEGRRIRAAFVAEPGRLLVSADYSQIELVVLAHLSGDEGLRAAFREGVDVHRRTASLLFGLPEAEVTAEQRRVAKTINFGVIYGMSAFRLSNELKIPRAEAQKFIDAYFATYAGVQSFIRATVAETEARGWSSTIAGRRRPIAAINSRNKTEKQAAERVAVNTPIQGSAADIVKLAMIRVDRALKAEAPRARLLLQVHDELIVEAPEAEAEAVAALVKREMELAAELSLPLRASVETAASWGEMH
ncbi:MAG TPA: DNA polymerase I [Spirochaetales bacterium]|nr:DNA polymerase I [Spirochaetales bacterium]HRY55580.1 DNA polymerase I [Spirochaetia bacterium]HRZ63447.1 DNA polymerase I [Spirochaetia bacterium]